MAQRMTHTKAILAQIQEHLGLPPIPLTPPIVAALPPAAPATSLAGPGQAVPPAAPTASAALPVDHPAVPTSSQDDGEVSPPVST